jgi:hypothetical protein
MNLIQLAWAAGLYEGEGTVRRQLEIEMTDKDVITKFRDIMDCGYVTYRERPGVKPTWRWRVGNKHDVARCLTLMLPFFGNRRAYKALNILDSIELT